MTNTVLPGDGKSALSAETIIGSDAVLRLSPGTARLIYRGLLARVPTHGQKALPDEVIAFLERRRAMIGCDPRPLDLRNPPRPISDSRNQRALAYRIGGLAATMTSFDLEPSAHNLTSDVRVRMVATLIELYQLVCANLPTDLTLPLPVSLVMPAENWDRVELERLRLRCEGFVLEQAFQVAPSTELSRRRSALIDRMTSLLNQSCVPIFDQTPVVRQIAPLRASLGVRITDAVTGALGSSLKITNPARNAASSCTLAGLGG